MLVVGDPFRLQFRLDSVAHLFRLSYFPHAGDHREHDAQMTVSGSTEQSTELCAEYLRTVEADTESTVTKSRVLLFGQFKVTDLLVRTGIKGSDDDFLVAHFREDLLVCLKLIVFCRIVVTVQVKELTSEQADTARIVGKHRVNILGASDVAVDPHGLSVKGHVFLALQFLQHLLILELFSSLLHEVVRGILVGIHKNLTGGTVDDRLTAFIFRLHLVSDANDGRNAHCTCQNGGMAGTGSAFGYKSEDLGLVQLDRLAGSEVICCKNDRDIRVDPPLNDTVENVEDPVGDVLHVCGSRLHISVIHGCKHIRELRSCISNCCLCVVCFLHDQCLNGIFIIKVFRHQLVSLKEHSRLISGFLSGFFRQFAELFYALLLCVFESLPLSCCIFNGIAAKGRFGALIEIHRAGGNSRRYTFSLNRNHMTLLIL